MASSCHGMVTMCAHGLHTRAAPPQSEGSLTIDQMAIDRMDLEKKRARLLFKGLLVP